MPAALIQPNFEFLEDWAKMKNVSYTSQKDLIANPEVQARYQKEVDEANESFAKWEKVKAFRLAPDAWTVESGHLTPTMKLKRKIIKENYVHLYNDIYGL